MTRWPRLIQLSSTSLSLFFFFLCPELMKRDENDKTFTDEISKEIVANLVNLGLLRAPPKAVESIRKIKTKTARRHDTTHQNFCKQKLLTINDQTINFMVPEKPKAKRPIGRIIFFRINYTANLPPFSLLSNNQPCQSSVWPSRTLAIGNDSVESHKAIFLSFFRERLKQKPRRQLIA